MPSPAEPALADAIASSPDGRITAAEAMRIALYGGDAGFYTSGRALIGKKGDFITSVSAGSCFGTLLARHYIGLWKNAGSPASFLAVEQGAHDAQLASDLLDALDEASSPIRHAIHLCLIEPSPEFRSRQRDRLSSRLGDRLSHLSSPAELSAHPLVHSGAPGIFFANELLDALPAHRARFENGTWHELYVENTPDSAAQENSGGDTRISSFQFTTGPASSHEVAGALAKLPTDLPEPYETEVQLAPSHWIREVANSGFAGEICLIDYGLSREEYYAPHRSEGTLRRYLGHRTDGRLLEDLGAADLTVHVELTSLIEAAESAGLTLAEITDQHHFLIRLATPWLHELESAGATGDSEPRIRQLQTLTHPTSMGRAFKVLRFATAPP